MLSRFHALFRRVPRGTRGISTQDIKEKLTEAKYSVKESVGKIFSGKGEPKINEPFEYKPAKTTDNFGVKKETFGAKQNSVSPKQEEVGVKTTDNFGAKVDTATAQRSSNFGTTGAFDDVGLDKNSFNATISKAGQQSTDFRTTKLDKDTVNARMDSTTSANYNRTNKDFQNESRMDKDTLGATGQSGVSYRTSNDFNNESRLNKDTWGARLDKETVDTKVDLTTPQSSTNFRNQRDDSVLNKDTFGAKIDPAQGREPSTNYNTTRDFNDARLSKESGPGLLDKETRLDNDASRIRTPEQVSAGTKQWENLRDENLRAQNQNQEKNEQWRKRDETFGDVNKKNF